MTTETEHSGPKKLLFVHTPKSAGAHTSDYIVMQLGYELLASFKRDANRVWEDWTLDEVKARIDAKNGLLRTHTLAHGWEKLAYSIPPTTQQSVMETIKAFRARGWFTFTFIKHPGELLCSFYHYVQPFIQQEKDHIVNKHCPVADRTIDQFVSEHAIDVLIPAYWCLFDYIGIANDQNFSHFFKHHFGHTFQPGVAELHKSENLGYEHYCRTGEISVETRLKIEATQNTRIYNDILELSQQRTLNSRPGDEDSHNAKIMDRE